MAASARDDKTLLYLYGISEQILAATGTEVIPVGVDGWAMVEAVACGGFTCWVSRVDAKEYGEELQQRMENLDWLAAASVRHQRVVAAIYRRALILPARFATLFRSQESLVEHVKRRAAELGADFRRVAGADEYGVKIYSQPKVSVIVAEDSPGQPSGRDYLKRKSAMLRERTAREMTPQVEKFIAELRLIASDSVAGGSVTAAQRDLLWNGSLLVAKTARRRLEAALARFQEAHGEAYRVECTGPWPPYSFVAAQKKAAEQ